MAKTINAEEFLEKNKQKIQIVDVRDDEELILGKIENSINIPKQELSYNLEKLDKTKQIIVYCKTGDRSDEATDELNSLGYDAFSLEGGFKQYQEYINNLDAIELDVKGQMCPGPIIQIADTINEIETGQKIHVESDEDAFASDVKIWCDRTGNNLESLEIKDGIIKASIVKQSVPEIPKDNDKTFVVFSGDLDKTIAAFIIANGAASMGRNVTMFFTFWGLNILRKPEKVSVKK
ncbi:DsrE/DsrF/DrsH-like family protein, partial [Methanobrevibacter sp.]|uniref:DsrE/DsrF/DrsH-like family protein n=1 Tax=Methanobrevibacter sp. TaxID=66852 RepID=UPI00388E46ED